jgi:hypothetical protein
MGTKYHGDSGKKLVSFWIVGIRYKNLVQDFNKGCPHGGQLEVGVGSHNVNFYCVFWNFL